MKELRFDLAPGSWITIGTPFIGNGNQVDYSFKTDDADKRFWRVAVTDTDSDGDGLTDTEEYQLGTILLNPDTDNDGLTDSEEILLGSNPKNVNSDTDGIPDGEDADPIDAAVCWKRVPDSRYIAIELPNPPTAATPVDLGKNGHVLATNVPEDWDSGTTAAQTYVWNPVTNTWSADLSAIVEPGVRIYGSAVTPEGDVVANAYRALSKNGQPAAGPGTAIVPGRWIRTQSGDYGSFQYDWSECPFPDFAFGTVFAANYGESRIPIIGLPNEKLPLSAGSARFSYSYQTDGTTNVTKLLHIAGATSTILATVDDSGNSPPLATAASESGWSGYVSSKLDSMHSVVIDAKLVDPSGAQTSGPSPILSVSAVAQISSDLTIPGRETTMIWLSSEGMQTGYRSDTTGEMIWIASERTPVEHLTGHINARGEGVSGSHIWRNGKWQPISDLLPAGHGYTAINAIDTNDNGEILATATKNGSTKNLLLIPVDIDQENYKDSVGIRFCRWLDAFTYSSLDPQFADKDRDRFRIRIPQIIPNLTKMKIKATDLHGAVIDGAIIDKTTDGDYEVDMVQENGAMVSKPILLVSDGDDDKYYNGEGTDDGKNDQTLLADFGSKIIITFPELNNVHAEFHAQKAVGKLTLNIRYMSPSGELPPDKLALILLQVAKAQEIYRQIGIKVNLAEVAGESIPQDWLDARPAPYNYPANELNAPECASLKYQLLNRKVPEHHIRIGYVDATLKPDLSTVGVVGDTGGFTNSRQDGIIVSLFGLNRTFLDITAHELGHTLNLDHPNHEKQNLMYGEVNWKNNDKDAKRFTDNEFDEIVTFGTIDKYYVPNQ